MNFSYNNQRTDQDDDLEVIDDHAPGTKLHDGPTIPGTPRILPWELQMLIDQEKDELEWDDRM